MTDRERIMYAVIGELSSSIIPLVFKGGLITKLILQENDYFTIEPDLEPRKKRFGKSRISLR